MNGNRNRFPSLKTLLPLLFVLMFALASFAQETTGALRGSVKDPGGSVIPKATVEVSSPALLGVKKAETDGAGQFIFSNLPAGVYTLNVSATGFSPVKREGIVLQVGHFPSIDLVLKVGGSSVTVEVSGTAPVIDVTTTQTQTTISSDVINDVPRGRSFQSVIQLAPEARNEPLMGTSSAGGQGTGGGSPGNGGNGGGLGYSISGAADSENSYLVEGQDTENILAGYSKANVPMDFIEEVQIKTSGVEAEHGGALGGVVNAIMKKGSNDIHGSLFANYEASGVDAGSKSYYRYDPAGSPNGQFDDPVQFYTPKQNHLTNVQPGFTLGGALIKDRIWGFLGFAPQYVANSRSVDFGANDNNSGVQQFNQDTQLYYTYGRIDAKATEKIRVFTSWLYQYSRESGYDMPNADSKQGLLNVTATDPLFLFEHGHGNVAPNQTINLGADITITPVLISTTRFGHFFENYHDFGYPTSGDIFLYETTAVGGSGQDGTAFPASFAQAAGYQSNAFNGNYTTKNSNKHDQFDENLAWFKSGWLGTHNFKFGYQLNHLSNDINQHSNAPFIEVFANADYSPNGNEGAANCKLIEAANAASGYADTNCTGNDGYISVYDAGTVGKASSFNHGLFVQDAWTVGKGVTISGGVRFDKEYLPAYAGAVSSAPPISFGWGQKFAPRIGVAWDVYKNGKLKAFASYGVFYDQMKLNLAIGSFGGQYWNQCFYALNTTDLSSIDTAFNGNSRFCSGNDATQGANFGSGTTPAGLTFIENINYRASSLPSGLGELIAPNLKPYRQHESVFGVDYQLTKDVAVEVRWDRRRLDNVIEDSGLFQQGGYGSETFAIVNPGQGVDSTFAGYYNYLYGVTNGAAVCSDCGKNIGAQRSYDGLEFRVTKSMSHNWFAQASYIYSSLRGNYAGLTNSDLSDGGDGGRDSPNNSRSFDEPYFQYNAYGKSSAGPLATDRPNTFKLDGYYQLPIGGDHRNTVTFGLFQQFLQGSPMSTYVDVGYSEGGVGDGAFPVYVEGRGKWVDVSQNQATGELSAGTSYNRRTPWYVQTDGSLSFEHKLGVAEGRKALNFELNVTNLFNQNAVVAYYSQVDTGYTQSFIAPNNQWIITNNFYSAAMHAYDWKSELNTDGVILDSHYGKPLYRQSGRTVRFAVHFNF